MRILLASLVLPLALAGCGGKSDGGNASAPAAPVAAVTPPAGQNWTQVVSETPDGGYRMGNPDAPIKLVEYGSRTCPTCGMFGREAMQPLENNYVKTGKVSYEFREFLVHGPPDLPASLLGRCVGPEAFFPLLEQMYIEQQPFEEKMMNQQAMQALQARLANAPAPQVAAGWADYMGFVDFVKQRGVPEAKARACLANQAEIDKITKVMEDASANKGVSGTPSFFLNGEKLDAVTWTDVEKALKRAGA